MRIIAPQFLTRCRVQSVHDAPGPGDIHTAVDHDRCCLHAAMGWHIEVPGKPELTDVFTIDFFERAKPLLVVSAPMRKPVRRVVVGGNQARLIDARNRGPVRNDG